MIKLIIFDYDGVIVDSFPNIHNVYKKICKKLGKYCPEDLNEFKIYYGEHHIEFFDKHGYTNKERKLVDDIFQEEIVKEETIIYEGIKNVIKKLYKNYKLVLLTANYQDVTKEKLKKFGLDKYFNEIIGKKDSDGKRFEKVEVIKRILNDYGLNKDEIILIGDRNIDFEEGMSAGLKHIILVDYGWGYDKLKIPEWEQKFVVKKPIDLIKVIDMIKD